MKLSSRWGWFSFLQTLLLSVCPAASSYIGPDVFLGQTLGKAMSTSQPAGLGMQKLKVNPVKDGHATITGLLAAEAKAATKARSMVAAELAMEAQAAAKARAAEQVQIVAEERATAKAQAVVQDRVAAEAEVAQHVEEQVAATQAVGSRAAAEAREAVAAQEAADVRYGNKLRATVAAWAAKEARAEAEEQVVTFAHKVAAVRKVAMRSSAGAATPTQATKHHTPHHHSIPPSLTEGEIEARLHGLRAAEQAAVVAHSRKLALKLELQVVNLENVELNMQDEKQDKSLEPSRSSEELAIDSNAALPAPEEIGWWEWSVHARIDELRNEKKTAIGEGDAIRAKQFQQQIDALEQAMKLPVPAPGHNGGRASSPNGMLPAPQVKMFSANQRLSEEDALALYRLGHVVGALLDRHHILWWAAGGTLLGAVRNKGIIPHDDDIDYNILNDQTDVLLSRTFINALTKNGLTMHRVEEGFWQIRQLHPKGAEILHVDVFAMWRTSYACHRENVICYPHGWWHKHTFPTSLCPLDTDEEARRLSTRMTQLESQLHQRDAEEVQSNLLSDWPTPLAYYRRMTNATFSPVPVAFHQRMADAMSRPSPATSESIDQNKQISCPLLRRWQFGKSGYVWGPPEDMAKSYLKHVYGPDWQKVARCQDTNHPCGLIQNATHDATEALEPSAPLEEPL